MLKRKLEQFQDVLKYQPFPKGMLPSWRWTTIKMEKCKKGNMSSKGGCLQVFCFWKSELLH